MEQAQADPESTVTSQTVQAWLCKAVTTKKKSSLRTQDNLSSRTLYLAYFQCSWRIFEAKISGAPVQHLLFPFPPPLLFLLLALAGFTPTELAIFSLCIREQIQKTAMCIMDKKAGRGFKSAGKF